MKIDSSTIAMSSNRNYESIEANQIKGSKTQWVPTEQGDKQDKLTTESSLSKFANDTKKLLEDQASAVVNSENRPQGQKPTFSVSSPSEGLSSLIPSFSQMQETQFSIIRQMLALLTGNNGEEGFKGFAMSSSTHSYSMNMSMSVAQPIIPSGQWVKRTEATHFFSEHESTSFSATGIAKTQDGREIAFNVDLQMSRSFMEYTNISWDKEVIMTDPLVINLNSNPASLSDQKFFFDIDSDGKEDEISQLNQGSGYLALDKDGNGKIDNGSELFGAKTGNGFDELSAYDSDKNGWIDENDEIYNKLKVWVKNEDNTDSLISLKDADVGAIYLGNSPTDFTLKSAETGQVNGQVTHTGVYLKESTGMAETIQQIDLAV